MIMIIIIINIIMTVIIITIYDDRFYEQTRYRLA